MLAYAGLWVLLGIVSLAITARWQSRHAAHQAQQQLGQLAFVLRDLLGPEIARGSNNDNDFLQQRVRQLAKRVGVRITLIDPDGDVVADSDMPPEAVGNCAERPEVRQATAERPASAVRVTASSRRKMLYVAVRYDEPGGRPRGFIRVGQELRKQTAQQPTIRSLMGAMLVAWAGATVALGAWLAGRFVRRVRGLTETARALARGDFAHKTSLDGKDELGQLAAALNQAGRHLSQQVGTLKQTNQRLLTVLESMSEGVVAVDQRQRILFLNDAARQLLRISAQEVEGRSLLEVVRHHVLHQIVENVLNKAEPCRAELDTAGPDRRHLAVQATAFPGMPPPGAVLVLHDITELRRLENMRQEFFANVSHELKTPLSSIKAYAETLLTTSVDEDNRRRFVVRIQEQAERLHQLILDMLSLSRLESGHQALEIGRVPLRQTVEAVVSQYQPAAEAKQIELKIDTASSDLDVRADAEGLHHILGNLIDNAIKYTPESGCVTVGWKAEDDHALIEVCDTGIGIPAESQLRIFERFYRVDKARFRVLGGTGLGLSIVKHLVQSFGGSVDVESRPGEGSTFIVRLPLFHDRA